MRMRRSARWALRPVVVGVGLLAVVGIVVLIMAGIAVVRAGAREFGTASALSERGRTAVGTVISKQILKGPPHTGETDLIRIRFTADDGDQHVVRVEGDRRVGARIRVLYDPADPHVAVTESLTTRRFRAVGRILVGVAIILSPLGIFGTVIANAIGRWRKRRTAPAAP